MANLVTYAKQKWEDAKTAITAARLNNMEQGINDCATQINALGDSVSQLIKKKTISGTTTSNGNITAQLPHGAVALYAECSTQVDGKYVVLVPYYFAEAGIGLACLFESCDYGKVVNKKIDVTIYYIDA